MVEVPSCQPLFLMVCFTQMVLSLPTWAHLGQPQQRHGGQSSTVTYPTTRMLAPHCPNCLLAPQTRAHLAQLQAVAQEQSKTATDRVHAMQYDVTTMQERLETAEASAA